ncbi:hypothetical protein V5799_029093 [Amblyomma americanum]|uniref:RING-type domain-containing protein n=1 Tax=Amblyomma americanum TaxID=6943 RepID=A0AAQ4E151_AMBAM
MAGTEYTLTGFDDFPERQRIGFVEPLPGTRVCGVCGVVPYRSVVLPCGHILCQVCKDQIPTEGGTCPLDGMEFAKDDIVRVTFKQSYLKQHRVFCVAGREQCSFEGRLCDMKDHLTGCASDKGRCPICQQSVVRSAAVEHCRQCSAESPPRKHVSPTAISSALEKLGDMRKDLEGILERASSEDLDKTVVVDGVNSLKECVASLEGQFANIQKETSGDQCSSLLAALKTAACTPGPYRSVSKHGNFIGTCVFPDVYARNKALKLESRTHAISSEICTLAGYTFKLRCLFPVYNFWVRLSLIICEGAWDSSVEWPFSKKVTLILTHPACMDKDKRLSVNMQDLQACREPVRGSPNVGAKAMIIPWADVELHGFIANNALYVNVEFE